MFLMKSRWPGASNKVSESCGRGRRLADDGDIVVVGAELPQSDIDGDTTLAFGLEFVEHPGILEGALAEFGSFLRGISMVVETFNDDKVEKRIKNTRR
jgi:hypothetical protein